jgi:hypothetical protein
MFGHMGEMTPDMNEKIKPLLAGQEVWDLGAGGLHYSQHLLKLGAKRVVAVDRRGFQHTRYKGLNICPVHKDFVDVDVPAAGIRVAFVSWPTNQRLPGLIEILRQCDMVIYLGSNTDGSACGWDGLFRHFAERKVLHYLPIRRNSLIVYGARCSERPLLGEEFATISGQLLTFDQAQAYEKPTTKVFKEAT